MGVEIWCDCTSYASCLCEEKERLKKWLYEMEMRIKKPLKGQKLKGKKKWNDPRGGKLRRGVRSLSERPKSLPREDSKWGVYLGMEVYPSVKTRERRCIAWLHVSICIMVAFGRRICIIYQVYIWIYYSSIYLDILFKTKMTCLFCKFRIVDILDVWLNKENDNFDCFKFVWLGFLLVCIM